MVSSPSVSDSAWALMTVTVRLSHQYWQRDTSILTVLLSRWPFRTFERSDNDARDLRQEHEAFRDAVGTFLDKEVVPHHDQWERDGIVDREVWAKAGAQGLLGLQLDEEYGGGGTPDFRYNVVIGEEMTNRGVYGAAFPLFNDMIVPYLVASANEEQRQRWFPDLASGEKIAAIAMTEPGAGSDLQGMRTTRRRRRATTTSSTARRPSSPTASSPTW